MAQKKNSDARDGGTAFVFKNRGALLSLPALMLVGFGKPSAFSVALGLPLALAGELVRCWAVGYSGTTTRHDKVTADALVTAGPYAYMRNPLYSGNFITALGFTIAFTGKNSPHSRLALSCAALGSMAAVYATIIPHEERYLEQTFGAAFDEYCLAVPRIIPRMHARSPAQGTFDATVIAQAETKTFGTFGAMLVALAVKALRA